jgi:hypothetical protein
LPPYHPELNPIGEWFFFGSSSFFAKLILCFLAVWHFVSFLVWVDAGYPFFCPIFSILGVSIFFSHFWVIWKLFFQLFGRFMSTHFRVDAECPTFFWPNFFILGLAISGGYSKGLRVKIKAIYLLFQSEYRLGSSK